MSVTYKDIDQLSQKSAVAGTEKIPVSDTQYITSGQISSLSGVSTETAPSDFEVSDESGYSIVAFSSGHIRTKFFNSENFKNITVSSSEPTSADGSDGDIWIVI